VAEKGQLLLQLVECSSLEHEFRDFLEAWATASSAVDDELKWSYLALSWIVLFSSLLSLFALLQNINDHTVSLL